MALPRRAYPLRQIVAPASAVLRVDVFVLVENVGLAALGVVDVTVAVGIATFVDYDMPAAVA